MLSGNITRDIRMRYYEDSPEFMRQLRKRKPWRRRRSPLFSNTRSINRNVYNTDHEPFGTWFFILMTKEWGSANTLFLRKEWARKGMVERYAKRRVTHD
jgi:hypothetical protein